MCGISGIVDFTGSHVDRRTLESMTRALAHRGPDDEGIWLGEGVGLGHRRLSIIDLSAAGHQPMANEDETLWITYNGEVYNANDIRPLLESLGHRFRSATDTEVVLRAFEQWGEDCLQRFNGMFAFAIWDTRRRRLFAARDRFGIKPFYFWQGANRLAFASEIKALLKNPQISREPNLETAAAYIDDGRLDGSNETFFKGIARLGAGHSISVSSDGVRTNQYYRLDPRRKTEVTDERDAVEAFRALLDDAIRIRLISDVPVATNLSGGLDSTIVATIAANYLGKMPGRLPHQTFSACFPDSPDDERPYIDIVAQEVPIQPSIAFPRFENILQVLEEQVLRHDQPVMSAAMHAKGEVMRLARSSGYKVVLEGQGADEYLCGYSNAVNWVIADLLLAGQFWSVYKLLKARGVRRRGAVLRTLNTATDIAYPSGKQIARRLRSYVRPGIGNGAAHSLQLTTMAAQRSGLNTKQVVGSRLNDYSVRAVYECFLPFYLRADDHNSMAFGVEARVPFLDHRLVEFALSLPAHFRMREGATKWIAREAVRGVIPERIRTFPGKRAFPTPMAAWLRAEYPAWRSLIESKQFRSREFYNRQGITDLIGKFVNGDDSLSHTMWRILNYDMWCRCFTF